MPNPKSAIANLQSKSYLRADFLPRVPAPLEAAAFLRAQYSFILRLCASRAAAVIRRRLRRARSASVPALLRPPRNPRRSFFISSRIAALRASNASIANSITLFAIVYSFDFGFINLFLVNIPEFVQSAASKNLVLVEYE